MKSEEARRLKQITGTTTTISIDPRFLGVCESGSVEVISVATPVPTLAGAMVAARADQNRFIDCSVRF